MNDWMTHSLNWHHLLAILFSYLEYHYIFLNIISSAFSASAKIYMWLISQHIM